MISHKWSLVLIKTSTLNVFLLIYDNFFIVKHANFKQIFGRFYVDFQEVLSKKEIAQQFEYRAKVFINLSEVKVKKPHKFRKNLGKFLLDLI